MSQSDDAADYKRRKEIAIGDAARLQLSQMIAVRQEQTFTAAAELTYTDKMQMREWSATKIMKTSKSNSHAL